MKINKKDQEAIAKARALRKRNFEESKKASKSDVREDFRVFFVIKKNELNLDPSLEEVIWLHLKASGFDSKEKFEEGLKHFGF